MDIKNLKPQSGRILVESGKFLDVEKELFKQQQLLTSLNNKPVPFAKSSEICEMPENGYRVKWLDHDGNVYVAKNNVLQKSSDWGGTWEIVINQTDTNLVSISSVRKLDSGELVFAGLREGIHASRIWKTDENEENPREVLAFELGQGQVYSEFGFTHFGDKIFAASYGMRPMLTECVVWASADRGETWTKIFSRPEQTQASEDGHTNHTHLHDVAYDPYENIIWVCAGDSNKNPHDRSFIYWSNDWGKTWHKGLGYRSSLVIPFPHSVLFGSDESQRLAVVRYDRPYLGTAGVNLNWHGTESNGIKNTPETHVFQRIPGQAEAYHWATVAAIQYGKDPQAYFGFRNTPENGTDSHVPTVWGTTDGIRFSAVWSLGRRSTIKGDIKEIGILGVFGPDNNNNLAVALSADVGNGREHQLLKIELSS